MRKPKLRELWHAIKAVVAGPYTSKFPAEMPEIPDGFRGAPEFHEEDCVGCGACYNVCPGRAIELEDDAEKRTRRLTIFHDRCIFCGTCEKNCITEKGVTLSKKWNLVTTDRKSLRVSVEKALIFCEVCGELIGPRDHVLWVADRLGHLSYTNPTLVLTRLREMKVAEPAPPSNRPPDRRDRIRIACPKCRQEISLVL